MDTLLVVAPVIGVTTLVACGIVRRTVDGGVGLLHLALQLMLECVGAAVIFMMVNAIIAASAVLLARLFTPWFISIYAVTDSILVTASFVQGFLFQVVWRSAGFRLDKRLMRVVR